MNQLFMIIIMYCFSMTQSSFLVPGEDEEPSESRVTSHEEDGSLASNSSGFGSLPRKDRPSVISRGKQFAGLVFDEKHGISENEEYVY